jgi:hypothetical protein
MYKGIADCECISNKLKRIFEMGSHSIAWQIECVDDLMIDFRFLGIRDAQQCSCCQYYVSSITPDRILFCLSKDMSIAA